LRARRADLGSESGKHVGDLDSLWPRVGGCPVPLQGGLPSARCRRGIHLTPADRGKMWGPEAQKADRRTMVPSDIRGRQSDVLEVVLPRIRHPALRARIADVVWTNDLRKGAVAKVAIDAYCDCIEGLMDGSLKAAFPVDGRDLPGSPDIVFPRLRSVVFVHGCFWHRHKNCRKASIPATRADFWIEKLSRNVVRDADAANRLGRAGWRVLVIWECETRDDSTMVRKLTAFLAAKKRADKSFRRKMPAVFSAASRLADSAFISEAMMLPPKMRSRFRL
jgi:DNA mismatch endonuclease Vsr